MKYILILTIVVFSGSAIAQGLTVKDITEPIQGSPDGAADDAKNSFPIFESALRPEVAKKINLYLQLMELNLVVGHQTKSIFEKNYSNAGYSYSITVNTNAILTVTFESQNCSMHCSTSQVSYSFDTRTGDVIRVDEVFTADGLKRLKASLFNEWKKVVQAHINDPNTGPEYKDCLANAAGQTELDFDRMQILEGKIEFWGGYCLSQPTSYQDFGHADLVRTVDQLKPYLTAYGTGILTGSSGSKTRTVLNTLLRGKIGDKYPVSIILHSGYGNEDASVIRGVEVYDKVGVGIALVGTMRGNKIVLHEVDDIYNKPVSDMELIWDGQALTGTFKNIKNNNLLSFSVSNQ